MLRKLVGVISLLILAAGCGAVTEDVAEPSQTYAGDTPTVDSSRVDGIEAAAEWPRTREDPSAGSCVYSYPEDLDDRPYAFDGTVVSFEKGDYVEDAGGTPVELQVEVNEAFIGDLSDTVTLHTWDFDDPGAGTTVDPTGARILAATGDTMDVMGCGFTRPYSAEDAARWRTTFGG